MASTETTKPARSWSRLDGVDILRGLAIFFVLMNHVNMRLRGAHVPYTKGLPDQLVDSLVWNGQQGVQIFFAVSGFLITSTAIRRWGSLGRVNIREFYQLRFARIAPLLLLLLAVLSVLHLARISGFIVSPETGGLGRALLAALTFHINLLEAQRGYLPVNWDILWSLSVEETFYLVFPIACLVFRRVRFLLVPLLAFVALGPLCPLLRFQSQWGLEGVFLPGWNGCNRPRLPYGNFCRAVPFFAPSLDCAGVPRYCCSHIHSCVFRPAVQMGSRTQRTLNVLPGYRRLHGYRGQRHSRSGDAPRIFKPLLGLGQHSYEIYLTHGFIVLSLFNLFVAAGKPMMAVPILFAVVIVLAALLGMLVARGYSEPVNRWLRNRWGDGPGHLGSVVEGIEVSETPKLYIEGKSEN
jgi:peptidoglycan/LPS O-acetylase OafA/YrhL